MYERTIKYARQALDELKVRQQKMLAAQLETRKKTILELDCFNLHERTSYEAMIETLETVFNEGRLSELEGAADDNHELFTEVCDFALGMIEDAFRNYTTTVAHVQLRYFYELKALYIAYVNTAIMSRRQWTQLTSNFF